MITTCELLAFAVSMTAFIYGSLKLFQIEIPRIFRLYVYASGCYMLEELWVIVNYLLGNGVQDGLVTVRLFGFFGCLCFLLSAGAQETDKNKPEDKNRRAKIIAFAAPAVLLALYGCFVFSPVQQEPAAVIAVGLVSISPALVGSYFSLLHLLLLWNAKDALKTAKAIEILLLAFYTINYLYPIAYLYIAEKLMSLYDLVIAGMLFVLVVLCRKEASKWETHI